jgi:hypothetical protein
VKRFPSKLGLGIDYGVKDGLSSGWLTWHGAAIDGGKSCAEIIDYAARCDGLVLGVGREYFGMIDAGLHLALVDGSTGALVDSLQLIWLSAFDRDGAEPLGERRWKVVFGHVWQVEVTAAPVRDLYTGLVGFFRGTERLWQVLRRRRLVLRRLD